MTRETASGKGEPVSGYSRDSMICVWYPQKLFNKTDYLLVNSKTFEVL